MKLSYIILNLGVLATLPLPEFTAAQDAQERLAGIIRSTRGYDHHIDQARSPQPMLTNQQNSQRVIASTFGSTVYYDRPRQTEPASKSVRTDAQAEIAALIDGTSTSPTLAKSKLTIHASAYATR